MNTLNKPINMKKLILSFVTIGILASCGSSDKQAQLDKLKKQRTEIDAEIKTLETELAAESGNKENKKTRSVLISALDFQPFQHYIEVQGKVDGNENVIVSAKMGGAVSKILVKEGDNVTTGQVLAELDNQVILQGMEELKTALNFATTMYEKQKSLWDQKIGTEVQYLSAKNNKESLEKKLATFQEQLEMMQLKSPINGTVDGIDIKIGQTIMPGMPAIRVVNLSNLKVKAEVAEAYSSKVKKGNDVLIYFPDMKKEIRSVIGYSAKVINNTTRTFMVESPLENSLEYNPNMIAVLKIADYKQDSSIVIPLNIIQNVGGSVYVYVAVNEGGKTISRKKEVVVGQIYNGNAEIKSGLTKGDKLIVTGFQDLNDGELIKF
ncbi:MAG: efflux RND transporter periplasmic adaptor subunit [Bacteroidota bacterium]